MTSLPFLSDRPNVPLASLKGQGYWQRSGSCDQCASGSIKGECCTHLAFPVSETAAANPDVVHFFRLHGVEIRFWGDQPLAIVPLPCSQLQANGDCGLYGQPERPDVCQAGPLNPWAGALNPHCSYSFEWAPSYIAKERNNGRRR